MKVTQEKLPASQIGLEIEISAETSKSTYDKVVQNLTRTANIPGFRKGKVPRQILLQQIGTQRIKATALEELIQKGLDDALKQENIESLGNYQLLSNFDELVTQYQPGNALIFSASVDVAPTLTVSDYSNLSFQAEETPYNPKKVEDWLEERRNQQATLVPVEDRPAQMGDVVVIDYQGFEVTESGEAGEAIAGVEGSDFKVDMLEGRLVEGMVEGMVGMKPEETRNITVTFPEDYQSEDLAGKLTVFMITLKELKSKELPELDDDFAEEVSEFSTFAELRESLEKRYQEEAESETKSSIHKALKSELVKLSTVELPESMIEKEIEVMLTQTAMQLQEMGIDIRQFFTEDLVRQIRQNSRREAIEHLTQNLVIKEIAKREEITPDEEAIAAKMVKVQEQLSDREIDLKRLREVITEEILTEKTLDWLQEKARIELVPKGTLNPPENEEKSELESEDVIDVVAVESTSENESDEAIEVTAEVAE